MVNTDKYTTLIWDYNGTIVDDARLAFDIYCNECDLYGLQKFSFEEYRNKFYFPVENFYIEVGLPKDKYKTVADRFSVSYRNKWNTLKLLGQIEEYLKKFKNAGISQFILSAYEQNELRDMVKYYKIEEYFTEIAGIEDNFAGSKVARGRKLFENHKIIPQNTLMIGDTTHDFEVAKELGTDIVLISRGTMSHERLVKECGEKNVFYDLKGAFGSL